MPLQRTHQNVAFANSFGESFDNVVLCGDLLVLDVELLAENFDDHSGLAVSIRAGLCIGFCLRIALGHFASEKFLGQFPCKVLTPNAKRFRRFDVGLNMMSIWVPIVFENRVDDPADRDGDLPTIFAASLTVRNLVMGRSGGVTLPHYSNRYGFGKGIWQDVG